ncbi:MAG: hypothetical protein K6E20_04865 [Acholeplasmatales bacterium]|nr:hypothetical protein [Acholeplasmatales bacterium]
MPTSIKYILIILITLFVLLIVSFVISVVVKNRLIKKMNKDIDEYLNKRKNECNGDLIHIEKNAYEYEYKLTTEKRIYFIKIIPNFANQEITINNSVKWQLRKTINDTTLKFVENVEPLMRMDVQSKIDDKETVKLYIIYPNARTLLRYVNECEMEFVSPKTDVYGTRVVTFANLLQNGDSILK